MKLVTADAGTVIGAGLPKILAVVTMTMGNLVAIQQKSIKRMLAYSSIAHAGYMMLALPVVSIDSIEAIMIYLFVYLFMNLGAFFIVIIVKNKTDIIFNFEKYNTLINVIFLFRYYLLMIVFL